MLWVAIVANILLTSTLAILLPGILAILSLAIPARARAVGFSVASWWAIPGLALLPLIGWIADNANIHIGMLVMAPILAIGGLIIASGGTVIAARHRGRVDRLGGTVPGVVRPEAGTGQAARRSRTSRCPTDRSRSCST